MGTPEGSKIALEQNSSLMRYSLWFEKWYPYLGGLIFSGIWFLLCLQFPQKPEIVLSSTLTLSAIIMGFLTTAKAIIISIKGGKVWSDMHDSTYLDLLVSYLAHAIYISFIFCIITLFGLFFCVLSISYQLAWAFFASCTALTFIRVVSIFLRILKHS